MRSRVVTLSDDHPLWNLHRCDDALTVVQQATSVDVGSVYSHSIMTSSAESLPVAIIVVIAQFFFLLRSDISCSSLWRRTDGTEHRLNAILKTKRWLLIIIILFMLLSVAGHLVTVCVHITARYHHGLTLQLSLRSRSNSFAALRPPPPGQPKVPLILG